MNIFDFDLAGIFSFTVSPLELMLRGTPLYWFLFMVLRFTSAPRLCLVRDGKLLRRNMCREFITDEALNAKIRHEGVADIAAVKRMYLEAHGEMSVICKDEPRATA